MGRQRPFKSWRMVHIGFGHYLAVDRVLAIMEYGGSHSLNVVQEAKRRKQLVNMTRGHARRSVYLMDGGLVVLGPVGPKAIAARFNYEGEEAETGETPDLPARWAPEPGGHKRKGRGHNYPHLTP